MRPARLSWLFLLALAAALGGWGAWLLHSAPGLTWALAHLERAAGGALRIEGADGSLYGGVSIKRVRYESDGTSVEARDVTIFLSPRSLAVLSPRISALRCAELIVTPRRSGAPPGPPATLSLPISIAIDEARLDRLTIAGTGAPLELSDIRFGYEGGRDGHVLRDASLEVARTRVAGRLAVGSGSPFPVEGAVTARRSAPPAVETTAVLSGTLHSLRISAEAASGEARAKLAAVLAPLTPFPFETLEASLSGLDLRAFDAGLPHTALDGELTLRKRAGAAGVLEGDGHLANRLAGPYDRDRLPVAAVSARLTTDLASAQLAGLRVDLGAGGALEGSGRLGTDTVTLTLQTPALDLSALHGRLRATRLAGRLDVDAGGERQSLGADLAERGLRIILRAQREGETVRLREVRVSARGGEARGNGRVTLAGARPFEAELVFGGFDPAAWGDFPSAALNGRATARGTLGDTRVIDVEFALDGSRLHDSPLSGSGRLSLRGDRLAAARADLALAENRITLSGAAGGADDVLSARLDAPRLAAIHPGWKGRAVATAQIKGNWRMPDAKFEVSGKDLGFGERLRAAAVSAKGEYAARGDGPLRLAASAAGLSAPEGELETLGLEVEGTRLAHVATLRARGRDLDLAARGRGAWRETGWSGLLEELENRGSYPLSLEKPVSVEAGRGRLRLGALAARFAEGRLDVREFRYEHGRITSSGQFSQLQARIALALAGLPPASGGTLRFSGSWSVTGTPRWHGTLNVRRESGDVALGEKNALALGLEALEGDARITEERIEFRAALRSRAATGQVEGSALPVASPEGARLTRASPLKFSARVEVSRLAAFAGLTDTALRYDGRVRASLTGSGTLGEPLFAGTLEGDDLSIAFPSEGVNLRAGVLRAELAPREIRVQSFSIIGGEGVFSARGSLARGESDRAAVEWKAERLTVMGRPDRRLVVTGSGTASLEGTKVSLAGTLRTDEGLVELRTATLPAPGDDVIISGRPRAEKETPRLRQAVLDLALDFGERFRITGRGLDTALAGRIRIQTGPTGDLVAKGSVRAVRGTYMAFGQRLNLERGQLGFEGPIDNPTLDIRAMRKTPGVDAGVEVAGTLRSPFVRVVSDPPMPENDALSWLILGHGPAEASSSDLTMLPVAAAALLGQNEAPGTGMARKFGLDSVGVRRGGSVGEQFVTVGKRLSDDIYIVYEQSLGATANVLKLEFTLSRRLLLRAETGETAAIGLFYRWAFD